MKRKIIAKLINESSIPRIEGEEELKVVKI